MVGIDLGVFAHNEAPGIGAMLDDLASQDIFDDPSFDVQVSVLANGCSDRTVPEARAALRRHAPRMRGRVLDLPEPGKSRTWEAFVHRHSRPEARYFIFCDADIQLPEPATCSRLVETLETRPEVEATSSRPVKDLTHYQSSTSLSERLIAVGGGTLYDWRMSICGQLYAIRATRARRVHMPAGLPVEDGFLRAMVLTDALSTEEQFHRLTGRDDAFHVYESERSITALIRHQVRIVIGAAVNAEIFRRIREEPAARREEALARFAADPDWLSRQLSSGLPRRPYGWVPFGLLTKRLDRIRQTRLTRFPIILLGFCFDAMVYLLAQIRMARGVGADFW